MDDSMKTRFYSKLAEAQSDKKNNSLYFDRDRINTIINRLVNYATNMGKTADDYNWNKTYEVFHCDDNGEYILRKKGTGRQIVPTDQIFDYIQNAHDVTKHGGRDKMKKVLRVNYYNITAEQISLFLELCDICLPRRAKKKTSIITISNPMIFTEINSNCQESFEQYFIGGDIFKEETSDTVELCCSNCCTIFQSISNDVDGPTNSTVPEYSNDQFSVSEMLSAIYKLNYKPLTPSSSSSNDYYNNIINETRPKLNLCSSCTLLLNELYSIFCRFNQIRRLDSELAKEIEIVDNLIIQSSKVSAQNQRQQQNNENNPGIINVDMSNSLVNDETTTNKASRTAPVILNVQSNSQTFKHSNFSPFDGPWVRVGPRLEEMEFEEIGYKLRCCSGNRFHKEPKLPKASSSLSSVVNRDEESDIDEGNGDWNSCQDDENYDDMLDIKLFTPSDNEEDLPVVQPPQDKKGKTKKKEEPASSKPRVKRPRKNPPKTNAKKRKLSKKETTVPSSDKSSSKGLKERRQRLRTKVLLYNDDTAKVRRQSKSKRDRNRAKSIVKSKCIVPGCGREFKKERDLRTHEKKAHFKCGPFKCTLPLTNGIETPCPFVAKSISLLRTHYESSKHKVIDESEKVTCSECSAVLQNQAQYEIHAKKHTEEGRRLYEIKLRKAGDKQKKKRAELSAKGFMCQICQVDFITKRKLTRHKMDVHKDFGTRYKTYVCELCGKTCVGQYNLNKHLSITHSDDKPFMCNLCGNRYKQDSALQAHFKRSHDDEGRLRYNKYMQINNKRRKLIAEALAQRQAVAAQQQQQQITDNNSVSTTITAPTTEIPASAIIAATTNATTSVVSTSDTTTITATTSATTTSTFNTFGVESNMDNFNINYPNQNLTMDFNTGYTTTMTNYDNFVQD